MCRSACESAARGSPPCRPLPETKKASRFREAFVFRCVATCLSLSSRTLSRRLNKDDAGKNEDDRALHLLASEAATAVPGQGKPKTLCITHRGARSAEPLRGEPRER